MLHIPLNSHTRGLCEHGGRGGRRRCRAAGRRRRCCTHDGHTAAAPATASAAPLPAHSRQVLHGAPAAGAPAHAPGRAGRGGGEPALRGAHRQQDVAAVGPAPPRRPRHPQRHGRPRAAAPRPGRRHARRPRRLLRPQARGQAGAAGGQGPAGAGWHLADAAPPADGGWLGMAASVAAGASVCFLAPLACSCRWAPSSSCSCSWDASRTKRGEGPCLAWGQNEALRRYRPGRWRHSLRSCPPGSMAALGGTSTRACDCSPGLAAAAT